MLNDILEFLVHWSHSIVFLALLSYYFRQDWQSLGATELLVREAMKLPAEDPTLPEKVKQIRRAQFRAVWRIRGLVCFMAVILDITLRSYD